MNRRSIAMNADGMLKDDEKLILCRQLLVRIPHIICGAGWQPALRADDDVARVSSSYNAHSMLFW